MIIVSSTPFHRHIYRSCSPDHTTKTPMSGGWSGPAFPKCLALVFGSFPPLVSPKSHFPRPRERSSILNDDVLVTEGTPGRAQVSVVRVSLGLSCHCRVWSRRSRFSTCHGPSLLTWHGFRRLVRVPRVGPIWLAAVGPGHCMRSASGPAWVSAWAPG